MSIIKNIRGIGPRLISSKSGDTDGYTLLIRHYESPGIYIDSNIISGQDGYGIEFSSDGYISSPNGELVLGVKEDSYVRIEGKGISFQGGVYGITNDGYAVLKDLHFVGSKITSDGELFFQDQIAAEPIPLSNLNQDLQSVYDKDGYALIEEARPIEVVSDNTAGFATSLRIDTIGNIGEYTYFHANDNAWVYIEDEYMEIRGGTNGTYIQGSGGEAEISAQPEVRLRSGGANLHVRTAQSEIKIDGRLTLNQLGGLSGSGADNTTIQGYDTSSAPANVSLLDGNKIDGRIYIFKDETGNASVNNITLTPESGTIDGYSSIVIDEDHGVERLYSNGTNYFRW